MPELEIHARYIIQGAAKNPMAGSGAIDTGENII
jgi:hypothetical protein